MAHGPRYAVRFRRRREGKTSYKKRLAQLKSPDPRMVVRKSNKYILVQFIKYEGKDDKVLLTVHSSSLKKLGWKHNLKNTPAAYLTGLLAGKLANSAKITRAISDIGLHSGTKGAKVFAVLKGATDSGLNLKLGTEVVPSADRIEGKHITAHLKKDLQKDFQTVKSAITGK